MPQASVINSPASIDIQIQRWPIEWPKPCEGSARTHSNARINQIAASVKEFGWALPTLTLRRTHLFHDHVQISLGKSPWVALLACEY
jgi:hypothetical protein